MVTESVFNLVHAMPEQNNQTFTMSVAARSVMGQVRAMFSAFDTGLHVPGRQPETMT